MEGLTITVAKAWEQVEQYAAIAQSCIKPGGINTHQAKQSWLNDRPAPIYVLLDYGQAAGYVRFLPIAAFLYSDYYLIRSRGMQLTISDKDRHAIWKEAVNFIKRPCLVNSDSYGGQQLKWIGPALSYQRINLPPGDTIWLVMPEEVDLTDSGASTWYYE